jgi:hypothetical protein
MDCGLGFGQLSQADLLLGEAVVRGDLGDPAARVDVGARVADVGGR